MARRSRHAVLLPIQQLGRHHCLASTILAQAGQPFRLFPRRGNGAPCGGNVPRVGRPLALES
eukprot:6906611-Lingulodinium_polyedra.AAC.1